MKITEITKEVLCGLKPGDQAHFRNRGDGEVEKYQYSDDSALFPHHITFKEFPGNSFAYTNSGNCLSPGQPLPLDIIAITKTPIPKKQEGEIWCVVTEISISETGHLMYSKKEQAIKHAK